MAQYQRITVIGSGFRGSQLCTRIVHGIVCEQLVICVAGLKQDFSQAGDHAVDIVYEADPRRAVQGADLVILCPAISELAQTLAAILPALKGDALLSDITGLNNLAAYDQIDSQVNFMASHLSSSAEICYLSPSPEASLRNIGSFTNFWESLGYRVEIIDAASHDRAIAITQQLPTLCYSALFDTILQTQGCMHLEDMIANDAISPLPSIAKAVAPDIPHDDFIDTLIHNKDEAAQQLEDYINALTALRKSIRRGDRFYIEKVLLQKKL